MQRAEGLGLGVSAAGHVLLFGALSLGFLATRPLVLNTPPMEVDLVSEVALTSTTPNPSETPPQVATAPEIAEPEPMPPPPPPPPPEPRPAPAPKPKPKPEPKPKPPKPVAAKPTPPKPNARPGNRPVALALSDDIVKGAQSERTPRPNATPAVASPAPAGPQVARALNAEISRQLKRHWRAPSGADADQLVTTLRWRLNPDGSLASGPDLVSQTGKTESNRPQQKLHVEAAIKAVRAAEPFNLPPEYYQDWNYVETFQFDRRL